MHDLRLLEPGRRPAWRAAILDGNAELRAHLVSAARQGGADVCIAAALEPAALAQIAHAACDVALLGLECSDPEPLTLAQLQCPIVLCSGGASPTVMRTAHRIKAMAFLVRPIRLDQLEPTIALAVARFQEQRRLSSSLEERKVIERAKGRLMALHDMTEDAAFRWLRGHAMDTRRRI